jgi:hypothetical protein
VYLRILEKIGLLVKRYWFWHCCNCDGWLLGGREHEAPLFPPSRRGNEGCRTRPITAAAETQWAIRGLIGDCEWIIDPLTPPQGHINGRYCILGPRGFEELRTSHSLEVAAQIRRDRPMGTVATVSA